MTAPTAPPACRVMAHVRRSFTTPAGPGLRSLCDPRPQRRRVRRARGHADQDPGRAGAHPAPLVKDHGGGGCRSIDRFSDGHFLESDCQWAERSWLSQEPAVVVWVSLIHISE